ncbi:MAG: hypothetical protein Q4F57_08665 [Weeksellaceae bacterium]|nr:hypothetical protein [Weeksellaceae bacterium]
MRKAEFYWASCGLLILLLSVTSSCTMLQRPDYNELSDGFYTQKIGNERTHVFVETSEEKIRVYAATKKKDKWIVNQDTV